MSRVSKETKGGVGPHDDKSDVESGRYTGVLAGSIECEINCCQRMAIQVWGVSLEFVTAVKAQEMGS